MTYQPSWQADAAIAPRPIQLQVRKVRSRAKMAILFMLLLLGVSALGVLAMFLLPLAVRFGESGRETIAMLVVAGYLFLTLVVKGAMLVTFIVFFCMWTYGANRAVRLAGTRQMEFTPDWAVGWYFIPFVNIIMTPRVVAELWRATDPEDTGRGNWRAAALTPLIPAWWGLILLNGVVALTRISLDIMTEGRAGGLLLLLDLFSTLLTMATGVLLAIIIRRVTDRLTILASWAQ